MRWKGGDVTARLAAVAARARARFDGHDLAGFKAILFVTDGFPWGVGARGYVGALFPVTDAEALEVGKALFAGKLGDSTFKALWRAQKDVYGSSSRRPYAMLGLPSVHVPVNWVDSPTYLQDSY